MLPRYIVDMRDLAPTAEPRLPRHTHMPVFCYSACVTRVSPARLIVHATIFEELTDALMNNTYLYNSSD